MVLREEKSLGNYNKQYENYYRKINNKSYGASPKFERNLGCYDLDKFKGRGYLKDEKISKHFYKELITSSFLSGCIFLSFFGMKYVNNDFINSLSEKFKNVISTDGYYKEMVLEDSLIVSALSGGVHKIGENKGIDYLGNGNISLEDEKISDNKEYLKKDEEATLHKENMEDRYKKEKDGENSLDRKNEMHNKLNLENSKNEVKSFSEFSVIKKTALDFLKESSVIVFDGQVKELDKLNIKEEYVYLKGKKGKINSLIKGKIKSIKKEKDVFKVITEHTDGLSIIYYNLGKVNKNEGEEIKENEVLGESAEGEIDGVLLQILLNEEYLNPKEHLNFLKDKISENK